MRRVKSDMLPQAKILRSKNTGLENCQREVLN
jgi:hypothetical protein